MKWIKEILCKKGKHKWHSYKSLALITSDEFTGLANVPMRECENCGKTEKR